MPDPRFFQNRGAATLAALAELTGARLMVAGAASVKVTGVAPLSRAGESDVSFFADPRYAADLPTTQAAACFLPAAMAERAPPNCYVMVSPEPQLAYAKAAAQLYVPRGFSADAAPIDPSATLEDDVELAPGVVLGANVRIGRGTRVGANTVIGPGVEIGRNCQIGAGAKVGFALIGDGVRLLAGAVIGEFGFGIAGGRSGMMDIPQLGRVVLQDGVTIGANSCVDRGAFEDTIIGEDTKIDNLVQIGHNVRLGRGCLVASQVGISGSTVVGDGVRFGGQAGIADHLNIGDGAALLARAGLMRDVPAGENWGGTPAVPGRQWLKQTAWLARAANKRRKGESDT